MDQEFVEIFQKYKNDIFRLAFSYTNHWADSEDITQKVFLKLYQNFSSIGKDFQKQWLVKVTINECKNLFLSSWRRKVFSLTEKEENLASEVTSDNELLSLVFRLPKKYRIVIFLYYYEGYRVKEIAKILKKSETSIQTQLQRARQKLKQMLEEGEK